MFPLHSPLVCPIPILFDPFIFKLIHSDLDSEFKLRTSALYVGLGPSNRLEWLDYLVKNLPAKPLCSNFTSTSIRQKTDFPAWAFNRTKFCHKLNWQIPLWFGLYQLFLIPLLSSWSILILTLNLSWVRMHCM